MSILFIADLHLDATRPAISRAFLQFLQQRAASAEALYILGDFFEAWVGDDDDEPFVAEIVDSLRQTNENGCQVYLMCGNRDFLLGRDFARQSGCQLLDDPAIITPYGERLLLMHGDSLCTDDHDYMQARRQLRSTEWQQQLLAKPLAERRQIAQQLRAASREANSNKPGNIMDVNADAVCQALQQAQARLIFHGHTHRPAQHSLLLDGGKATRVVLGDWDQRGWYIEYNEQHDFQLHSFIIPAETASH